MKTYNEMRVEVREFLKASNLNAYELYRISRDLCSCKSCKHFVQHYSKDGIPVDFGHCMKSNIVHSKKPSTPACGSWEDYE